eukprot:117482-Chlamydomonas_euryale.AAC.5
MTALRALGSGQRATPSARAAYRPRAAARTPTTVRARRWPETTAAAALAAQARRGRPRRRSAARAARPSHKPARATALPSCSCTKSNQAASRRTGFTAAEAATELTGRAAKAMASGGMTGGACVAVAMCTAPYFLGSIAPQPWSLRKTTQL